MATGSDDAVMAEKGRGIQRALDEGRPRERCGVVAPGIDPALRF